ncbi:hypothetical protein [Streptomyces albus]|uniref:Uncharacterized protein n=1 Tax=Streptomyces albus TaxID=1888 RepID=A0A8H1QM65_9ACTN|nr:hypothetical protein [Streptomyces albus]TGG78398.1 hypothetical protein D8771_24570 [Streptomyces albus]UVN59539.1 hypothetical protein NR995_33985 [Streptomyces albus]
MPKNQSTAAQAARRASRSGGKYTEALRRAKTSEGTPHPPHVLRFLAERSGNLYHLVGGIAAVWAHSGQRVLLLEEAESYWRWAMSGVGRSRSRRKKETEPAVPPEPTTSTLWASPDGPGLLTRHTCMWETRHPVKQNNRGFPQTDRSPLAAAVADAIDAYDVIVLLPQYWSYPDREIATAHVVLGEIDAFPDTDCRTVLPGSGGEEKGAPLSPEQSAAVLRERCLGFLFGSPHLPITLDGVIWQSNGKLPVDADYLAGVDRDMNRVGLRPLGWSLAGRRSLPHKQLPEPDQLKDPSFVQQYRPVAQRLHMALHACPANRN